jgi:hypothetical protein
MTPTARSLTDPPEAWLHLRYTRRDGLAWIGLRRLLKVLLRSFGWRCVDLHPPQESDREKTNTKKL